jgi:mono/diheme cytochrome c family protein
MKDRTNLIKLFAVALFALPATFALAPASAGTGAGADSFDAAAVYKAQCAACHGQKSEKKFDTAKDDDVLVEIVLKGRDDAKPIKMPAYEKKGINAEKAQALVVHMRSLRQ